LSESVEVETVMLVG